MLVQAVVENMSLSNREELIEQIKALAQPDPMAQQQQQQALAIQQAEAEAKLRVLAAQAAKYEAEAQKVMVEAQLEPQVVQAKMAAALATNLEAGQGDDKEFERRAKIAELMIKEKDIDSNERIARMQTQGRNVQ
jgi:hypothetical protein